MEKADEDKSKTIDLQEFLQFVRIMRTGNPHEGPITPKVGNEGRFDERGGGGGGGG